MKALISGSTGLVGSSLCPFLAQKGFTISRLVRKDAGPQDVSWDATGGISDPSKLECLDVVVHLAGESIATGRWTDEKKQRIRDSRVKGTAAVANALTKLQQPPKTLVCASAIGFYGNRGDEILKEDSRPGNDFLADVCQSWEAAAVPAKSVGIRVVHLRFGVILSANGGALAKMLPPFKMGAGGPIGSGNQYMSWIAIDDVHGIISHVIQQPLNGPVNTVAPEAVTNQTFTKTLGRVLSRPTVLPMPAFAARLAFGEMADALLLASQRVEPHVLHKSGYAFQFPALEGALRHVLKN